MDLAEPPLRPLSAAFTRQPLPDSGRRLAHASSRERHEAIGALLRPESVHAVDGRCYDCLPAELRTRYDIVDTTNISAHPYDCHAQELITAHRSGWVLDCGAGYRATSEPNVVNFEIVRYPSTDVLGVAEEMPFRDACFDAVICLNVLEHVKDPFKAAREIARVLKPGGALYCVVPFLQPLHGYPHHYYNMTGQGLMSLFAAHFTIGRQEVLRSGLPIWALHSLVSIWHSALPPAEQAQFAATPVSELLGSPLTLLDRPYVTALPECANFVLASTTACFATRRTDVPPPDDPARIARQATETVEHLRRERDDAHRQIAALDARLNRLRRSRWWRLRRRTLHLFGLEDGKD